MVFVDLTKAFDSVGRQGLWKILGKVGCPDKIINIIRSFHDGMVGRVIDEGTISDPFPVNNGTWQSWHLCCSASSFLQCFMTPSKTATKV